MSAARRLGSARLLLAALAIVPGLLGVSGGASGWTSGSPGSPADPAHVQDSLLVHFLDVGQGDAVLVRSPGGQNVLYDGGPAAGGVLAELRRLGVETLDLVIASHNHADHIGGLAEVIRAYRPRFVLDNGLPHTTLTYQRFLEAIEAAGSELLEPEARTVALGPASLRILPPPRVPGWDQNDNSVGVVIELGEFRAVLAGDAEARQWRWWLEEGLVPAGPVQLHKASHHGSRNGDVAEALQRLRPELVVVSAGAGNPYGHPHAEALALYRAAGAAVLSTAERGTVTVSARADGSFEVRTDRGGVPSLARKTRRVPSCSAGPNASGGATEAGDTPCRSAHWRAPRGPRRSRVRAG